MPARRCRAHLRRPTGLWSAVRKGLRGRGRRTRATAPPPPGFARLPARACQEMRGGCRHVRNAAPDVAVAVAIGIYGVGQKHRGQELRVPHGAGPGAQHAVRCDIALVHDAQRGQQFCLGPGAAAAFIGQRGQRVHGAERPEIAAVVALHAPDGGDHGGRHATAGGSGFQRGAVFGQLGLALGNALRRDRTVKVGPGCAREFRLCPVKLHHTRLPLRLAQHFAHRAGLDARLQGLRRKRVAPCGKACRMVHASGGAAGGCCGILGRCAGGGRGALAGSGVFTASGRWRGAAAQPARARAAQHAARESRDEEDKWEGRSRETEGLAGWVLCMRHCPALQRRCCAAGVSRREAASDEVFVFAIYFIAASALSVCARGLKSL